MPRIPDVLYAHCPFFKSSGKKNILCEGITEDSSVNLMFTTEDGRNVQRKIFCDAKYENCEIYRMVMEKYEE